MTVFTRSLALAAFVVSICASISGIIGAGLYLTAWALDLHNLEYPPTDSRILILIGFGILGITGVSIGIRHQRPRRTP